MTQTLKPRKNQLFCEPIVVKQEETRTTSGLYTTAAEKKVIQAQARVVNVGSNVEDVSSGDIVLYKQYSGFSVELNGNNYLVLDDDDVLGQVLTVNE